MVCNGDFPVCISFGDRYFVTMLELARFPAVQIAANAFHPDLTRSQQISRAND